MCSKCFAIFGTKLIFVCGIRRFIGKVSELLGCDAYICLFKVYSRKVQEL